jgi:hydrogenase-4 membrane subunit HyfE
MGKFARTWRLMGASWQLLVQDKRLVVFPLISGLALAAVVALFAVPMFVAMGAHEQAAGQLHASPQMYLAMFVFYFLAYFVIIFFNSGLIACVLKQMDGGQPTIGYGLAFAWQRLPQICGWALLASSVGMLLRILEERVGFIGRLIAGLLGMAWSVTSFLVVPVLVVEGAGPIESYRRSVEMLKRTWGEQIIGNVSFGLLFALFGIVPAIVLFSVTIKLGPAALLAAAAILAVWLVALALVQSTLQTIYQAAIYCYAANGEAPHGFDGSMIAEAFREKPTNKWL